MKNALLRPNVARHSLAVWNIFRYLNVLRILARLFVTTLVSTTALVPATALARAHPEEPRTNLQNAGFSTIDSSTASNVSQELRIGVMIQEKGEELYSWFGHAGIILSGTEDSLRAVAQQNRKYFPEFQSYRGEDLLFDYGNFDSQGNFLIQFLIGELHYYKLKKSYPRYLAANAHYAKRGITVYWLNLSPAQKQQLAQILFRETSPENQKYKYDFYFDNCLTRIRDQLNEVFAGQLQAQVQGQSSLSIRQILRREIGDRFWGLLLLEYLQGAQIDQKYSRWDSIFFPAHMPDLLQSLSLPQSNVPLIGETEEVFPYRPEELPQRSPEKSMQKNFWNLGIYAFIILFLAVFYWQKSRVFPRLAPTAAQKSGIVLFICQASYFSLAVLASAVFAILSLVLWVLTVFQSFDVALQNVLFALGTPFLICNTLLLLPISLPKFRRRVLPLFFLIWRIHAYLALALPLVAWLYALLRQQATQDILLPWLAISPILVCLAFLPCDTQRYFSVRHKRQI